MPRPNYHLAARAAARLEGIATELRVELELDRPNHAAIARRLHTTNEAVARVLSCEGICDLSTNNRRTR